MLEPMNPKTVHAPMGAYTHTIKVPPNAKWLVVSGQVGVNAKGQLQSGPVKQSEQAFRNVLACLRANGMSKKDLVLTRIYLTDARYIEVYRKVRAKFLGKTTPPAGTLLIVEGLASPDMCIEIEAWAAK